MFVLFSPQTRRKQNRKAAIFLQGIAAFFYSTKHRLDLHILPYSNRIPENTNHRGGRLPSPVSFFRLIWRRSVGCRSPPTLFPKFKNFKKEGLKMKLIAKEQQGDTMLLTFRDTNGDIIVQPVALDIWKKVCRVRNKYKRKEERALKRYIRYNVLEYIDGISEAEALYRILDPVNDKAEKNEAMRRVRAVIDPLTETQKQRVMLCLIYGLTYKQIAELEGVSVPAIQQSIKWSVKKIKKILGNDYNLLELPVGR